MTNGQIEQVVFLTAGISMVVGCILGYWFATKDMADELGMGVWQLFKKRTRDNWTEPFPKQPRVVEATPRVMETTSAPKEADLQASMDKLTETLGRLHGFLNSQSF